MKKWNSPEIEALDLSRTANGITRCWPEVSANNIANDISQFFGGPTIYDQPGPLLTVEEEGKGEEEHTSTTGETNSAS